MSDSTVLRLYFDYIDPASYLLESRLRKVEGATTFTLVPEPFELSPPPSPLLDPNGEEGAELWKGMEEEGTRLGIELGRPWIVPWSRKAHELARQAHGKGCFREIHDALFRAYLSQGLDIGRVDVLVDLARQLGLDPTETKAALDVDLHGEAVVKGRKEALEVGIERPPTLLWQGRLLEGYPEETVLREFLAL